MNRFVRHIFNRIRYGGGEVNNFLETLPSNTNVSRRNLIIEGCRNLTIGSNVYIGPNALIYCTSSKVIINQGVVIGPNLTIVAGDHNYTTVGKFIIDEKVNLKDNNQDIIIESDIWIGANVTILKGVTIGRGSVIAACTCVTKSIPPYSIVAGVPGRVIRKRFTEEQIIEHERMLYNSDNIGKK